MPPAELTKTKKKTTYLEWVIKLVVVMLLTYVVYRQVLAEENLAGIWAHFKIQMRSASIYFFALTCIAIPVNWGFETLKWLQFVRHFEALSFLKAFRAVMSGITLSIFTPNRIGEYGGRILYVSSEHQLKAVVATLCGSFSQLLVLMTFGILGMIRFLIEFKGIDGFLLWGLYFSGLLFVLVLLFCFYNVSLLIPLAKKLPFQRYLKRFAGSVSILKTYDTATLSRALFFATLRYLTYMTQYYWLLCFFGIELNLWSGLTGVATIFLLQTSIPLPPFLGLVVRGNLAIYIWSFYGANEVAILAATFTLWVLNLIIPAFLGMVFIVRTNVLDSLGYDRDIEKN